MLKFFKRTSSVATLSTFNRISHARPKFRKDDGDFSDQRQAEAKDATPSTRFIKEQLEQQQPGMASFIMSGSNSYYRNDIPPRYDLSRVNANSENKTPVETHIVVDAAALSYTLAEDKHATDLIGACADGCGHGSGSEQDKQDERIGTWANLLVNSSIENLSTFSHSQSLYDDLENVVSKIHSMAAKSQAVEVSAYHVKSTLAAYRSFAPQENEENYTFVGFGVGNSMVVAWNPWLQKFYNLIPAVLPPAFSQQDDALGDDGDNTCYSTARIARCQVQLPPGTFIISLTAGCYGGLTQQVSEGNNIKRQITLDETAMGQLLGRIPLQEFLLDPQTGSAKIAEAIVASANTAVQAKIQPHPSLRDAQNELIALYQQEKNIFHAITGTHPEESAVGEDKDNEEDNTKNFPLVAKIELDVHATSFQARYKELKQPLQIATDKSPSPITAYANFRGELELILAFTRCLRHQVNGAHEIEQAVQAMLAKLPPSSESPSFTREFIQSIFPSQAAFDALENQIRQLASTCKLTKQEIQASLQQSKLTEPQKYQECISSIHTLSQELTATQCKIQEIESTLVTSEGDDVTVQVSYLPEYPTYFLEKLARADALPGSQKRVAKIPFEQWLEAYSKLAPLRNSQAEAKDAVPSFVYSQQQLQEAMRGVFERIYAHDIQDFDKKGDAFYFLTQVLIPDKQDDLTDKRNARIASIPLKQWFDAFSKIAQMNVSSEQALYTSEQLVTAKERLYHIIYTAQEERLVKYRNWGIAFIFLGLIPGLIIFAIRGYIKSHQEIAMVTLTKNDKDSYEANAMGQTPPLLQRGYSERPFSENATEIYRKLFNRQGELRKFKQGFVKPVSNGQPAFASESQNGNSTAPEAVPLLSGQNGNPNGAITFFGTKQQIERLKHRKSEEVNEDKAQDKFLQKSKEDSRTTYTPVRTS